MDFLIAATSTYSLVGLAGDERESVKMTREGLAMAAFGQDRTFVVSQEPTLTVAKPPFK